jgi:hypothetical protein
MVYFARPAGARRRQLADLDAKLAQLRQVERERR